MSYKHPGLSRWEARLKEIFDRIDVELEQEYGAKYPLHPARSPHGTTSNREQDGLFNVGAAYSAGFGSEHGAGYVVEVRMSTLSDVEEQEREEIEQKVAGKLEQRLPEAFPGREIRVERDGELYKIVGDLSFQESN
jgi:hypothetical protein